MGHWESAGLPDDFDGIVRLFPLPNMVLFPHVVQALHIFEPRYCELLTEALEADHLITMALLLPGWESEVDGKPPIGRTVCIGRIVSHTPTDDGRHNILLAGLQRARIIEEFDSPTLFRQARVEILEDLDSNLLDYQVDLYRENLLRVFRSFMPQEASESKSFGEILTRQLPLGILIDIVSYAVSLPSDIKLALLSEQDVVSRYELLIEQLGGPEFGSMGAASGFEENKPSGNAAENQVISEMEGESTRSDSSSSNPPGSGFPPPFSDN